MKFIIDAQLPPVMAEWLRAAGHEAGHVEDFGLRTADDEVIWAHAARTGALILTKDEDFRELAKIADSGPLVVWLRIGNATNPVLRAWFEPRLMGIVQLAQDSVRIIEVI